MRGVLLMCAAGAMIAADRPTPPTARAPIPLTTYLDVRRVRDASFSHDDRLIAYRSDEGGRLDIWVQPVAGGPGRQITRVAGVIHAFAFSPIEDRLLVEVDDGGNDQPRLYFTDSAGSPWRELRPDLPPGSRIGFIRWAEDGRRLLYITNLPDQDFVELHEYEVASGRSTTLWKSPRDLAFALASPDLRRLVLQEVLSDVNFNLYLLDRGTPAPKLLTPHPGDVSFTPTAFSRDGRTLYYTSTGEGEFTALFAMDLDSGERRQVMRAPWDVERGEFSTGWRHFVTVTNADGSPQVTIRRLADDRVVPLPSIPGGAMVPVAFSPSDRFVAATAVSDAAPERLYVIDLQTGKSSAVADVLPEALRGRRMIAGRRVSIPSFDGRAVPALLYEPEGRRPFPAIIDVHGGPNAQARRAYSGLRQYLVAKGYAVLVPNVRGSTGYGRTYASLDDLDLGGGPLRDVIACKQWLAREKIAPADRVAIMGASYGGYMSLAAAAFAPREFAAHVDLFGISDLKRFVESLPPYWAVYSPYTFRKYGDPKNPAHARYQFERSPLNFVDRMNRPLLVVQGENDPQVRRDQSDRLVDALRAQGQPVEYLVLPGEGHGFSAAASRLAAYEAIDRFLDRYLSAARP